MRSRASSIKRVRRRLGDLRVPLLDDDRNAIDEAHGLLSPLSRRQARKAIKGSGLSGTVRAFVVHLAGLPLRDVQRAQRQEERRRERHVQKLREDFRQGGDRALAAGIVVAGNPELAAAVEEECRARARCPTLRRPTLPPAGRRARGTHSRRPGRPGRSRRSRTESGPRGSPDDEGEPPPPALWPRGRFSNTEDHVAHRHPLGLGVLRGHAPSSPERVNARRGGRSLGLLPRGRA